jgi:hypothetical protein
LPRPKLDQLCIGAMAIRCGGCDIAARSCTNPPEDEPNIPTLAFDHGCAAHHSTTS